jgi:hypothetical protein
MAVVETSTTRFDPSGQDDPSAIPRGVRRMPPFDAWPLGETVMRANMPLVPAKVSATPSESHSHRAPPSMTFLVHPSGSSPLTSAIVHPRAAATADDSVSGTSRNPGRKSVPSGLVRQRKPHGTFLCNPLRARHGVLVRTGENVVAGLAQSDAALLVGLAQTNET